MPVYSRDGSSDSFLKIIGDTGEQDQTLQDLSDSASDCNQESGSITRLGESTETFPKRIHELNELRRMLMLIPINSSFPPQHHTMSHPERAYVPIAFLGEDRWEGYRPDRRPSVVGRYYLVVAARRHFAVLQSTLGYPRHIDCSRNFAEAGSRPAVRWVARMAEVGAHHTWERQEGRFVRQPSPFHGKAACHGGDDGGRKCSYVDG